VSDGRGPFLPLVGVFGDPETGELLSERAAIKAWLDVESALVAAQASLGVVPLHAAEQVEARASSMSIDGPAMHEGMRLVGYPILPLLGAMGFDAPEVAATIHWGATTQDIMDSGLALVLRGVLARIEMLIIEVGDAAAILADRHRGTAMVGRTHGQPAVPTTFGAKVAVWMAEVARHCDRLRAARERAAVLSLFGAAGTSAALGPQSREVRRLVADRLGLVAVDVPWHTARDNLAEVGFVLAAISATCGKVAREVIDLSRPEIGELRERDADHRGASSTMPQKSNPIACEVVVGMSSLAAQQVPALLAAMRAGHERSAGEWQIEWDALPTVVALTAGCLANTRDILSGLSVFPDRMRANLGIDGGTIMAERVMMRLATQVGRAAAHDLVYEACSVARNTGIGLGDALVRTLEPHLLKELGPLDELLDPESYLGDTPAVVEAALEIWKTAKARRAEAGGMAT
jgi:3-carboxy-cis,cis-muconate cycloisomerase